MGFNEIGDERKVTLLENTCHVFNGVCFCSWIVRTSVGINFILVLPATLKES